MKLTTGFGLATLAISLGLALPVSACDRGGWCNSYSYSYAPVMPARPQYAARPAPRAAARSVAQAPAVALAPAVAKAQQPQVIQFSPVINITPDVLAGQSASTNQPAKTVAAAPTPPSARSIVKATEAAPPAPSAMPRNVEVVLTNNEQQPVAYSLNGTRYDMPPGHGQKLTSRPAWTVEFDRGGEFGTARYTLKEAGTYSFVATERGWELAREDDVPAPPAAGVGIARR